ncbi:hypothetical protein D2E25_0599 [Bifidobacterium goeldii]|uniref:Uncharacterized protein n=1 Tax=Bifidobacterium goeldii TaxID=2306975 RepID=A0A430FN93_9BIFI|nr:hypothetical protein [Bifidobacterium goeldii]RSX54291.1 hypothetical protein D2E25_0599 [Bifidobacterium goeldii]
MLNNAHSTYAATQNSPHNHNLLFNLFDSADTALDNASDFIADKFRGASSFLSKCDYYWDAQIIPAGLTKTFQVMGSLFDPDVLSGKKTLDVDPTDISDTKSLHDLFHDSEAVDNIPIIGDVLSQLKDHVPSDLITADFIKESIISNDGFLHKWGLRFMGWGIGVVIGGAVVGTIVGPMIAGLLGMGLTVGFNVVARNKEERQQQSATQNTAQATQQNTQPSAASGTAAQQQAAAQLGPSVARMNTLTGHGDGTSVDEENVMSEFVDRLRHGGLSDAEREGARAYFDDEQQGHVGHYLADNMDGRPLGNLRGYRWAMGLAAALGGAAAAKMLMNHGGPAGVANALADGAAGAAAAAGPAVSSAASAAASAAGSAMGAVGGSVSVMGIRGNLRSIVQDIMGNRSVLQEKTHQIEQLSAQIRQAMQGTNDTNMQTAFRQLEFARQRLDWANNMMLQQSMQYAQEFSDRL